MTAFLRRWSWLGVLVATLGVTGCNLVALPFFIFGPEPAVPAELKKLAPEDKKKETKVVILASDETRVGSGFIRLDRDLTDRMRTYMKAGFEYNKENVKIASSRKVEDFKNANVGWQTMDFEEVGKQVFGADYVIRLEIKNFSLYEKGSSGTLYRGRADIAVTLIDVNDSEGATQRKEFICEYPTEFRQAIPVDSDTNVDKFKNDFMNYVAQRLSWYFTSSPTRARHDCQ